MKKPVDVLVRGLLRYGFLALSLGYVSRAEAVPHCPSGMWSSQGSCCNVGSEYVPAKNQCMPVRPERRCVAGHLDDCVIAGRDLEQRGAAGASYSAELYRYACEEGYAPGCRSLGSLYLRGVGLDRDEARGRVLYEEACDGGDAVGCTQLAKFLQEKNEDPARVSDLLAQACHRGDVSACDMYGRRMAQDPQQFEQSAHYLGRACDGGYAKSCRSLMELERRHQSLDGERESALLERACRASDGEACALLGDALRRGDGAGKGDEAQMALRYTTACDGGHATSCMRLGELTISGEGVNRDPVRAAELFGKACGAGVAMACERVSAAPIEPTRSASRDAR